MPESWWLRWRGHITPDEPPLVEPDATPLVDKATQSLVTYVKWKRSLPAPEAVVAEPEPVAVAADATEHSDDV